MKRRKYFPILYWIFYAINYFCFHSESVLISIQTHFPVILSFAKDL